MTKPETSLAPEPPPSADRSALMRRVRDRDTKPEMVVRRLLYRLGYRYRLHARELPGRPDIVFRSRRKAIFVHGCFWHQHEECSNATIPKTRTDYWQEKFKDNRERDRASLEELGRLGWKTLVVWECETRKPDTVLSRLVEFLESTQAGCGQDQFDSVGGN